MFSSPINTDVKQSVHIKIILIFWNNGSSALLNEWLPKARFMAGMALVLHSEWSLHHNHMQSEFICEANYGSGL